MIEVYHLQSLIYKSRIDGQCIQTMQQPCISVWTVSALPNDDIVVGGSDAVVRLFSRAPERIAEAETQKVCMLLFDSI